MSDNVDINALLDAKLDDLEDLPEFKPFAAGTHKVLVSLAIKDINDDKAIEMAIKAIETLELANPTKDENIKEGDTTSVLFMLNNEIGRGKLKAIAKPLGASLGVSGLGEVVEQTKDIECLIVSSVRVDKQDPDRLYMNIKTLEVV